MDGAMATQRQRTVDGNGRHDGISTAMDSMVMDSDGRHDGNMTVMDGLTALDGDGRQLDGDGQCRATAMDGATFP